MLTTWGGIISPATVVLPCNRTYHTAMNDHTMHSTHQGTSRKWGAPQRMERGAAVWTHQSNCTWSGMPWLRGMRGRGLSTFPHTAPEGRERSHPLQGGGQVWGTQGLACSPAGATEAQGLLRVTQYLVMSLQYFRMAKGDHQGTTNARHRLRAGQRCPGVRLRQLAHRGKGQGARAVRSKWGSLLGEQF